MKRSPYGLKDSITDSRLLARLGLVLLTGFFFIFILCSSITQMLASDLGYSSFLGEPWIGRHFYNPFSWIHWYQEIYTSDTASYFHSAIRFNLLVFFLAGGAILLFFFGLSSVKRDKHPDLHGSARFATHKDIVDMGFLGDSGVYIGAFRSKKGEPLSYLRHDGPEHIMCAAPTRSGKGVSLVIPTLLSWPHSVVCYDIKGENWSLTSGWRKNHANNFVIRFDPGCPDGTGACYNPLAEIRLGSDHDVADAQSIALMIMDDTGKGIEGDHWLLSGYDFVTGLILHSLYKSRADGRVASLTDLASLVSGRGPDEADTFTLLEEMGSYPHLDGQTHRVCAETAGSMMKKADKELSGVVSTVVSKLSLYRDPIVSKNISRSDFKVADIMNCEKPVSLYLCVSVDNKDRMRPLTRLIFTQILRGLTKKISYTEGVLDSNYRHRLLMMMDEFPSLGRLDVFEESLGYLAGYGIRCYIIIQDWSQLRSRKAYGPDESITSLCSVRTAFAPNRIETAEMLSKLAGITTITKREVSSSKRGSGILAKSHHSVSYREVQRPLLTADEIMRMKLISDGTPGDTLICAAGQPVIKGTQIVYFNDPVFKARAKINAPVESDRPLNIIKTGAASFRDRISRRHSDWLAKATTS